MIDSYQKIIEQCDYYAINSMPGSYEQTSFLVLKSRLEALQKNPMFYADSRGDSSMPPIPARTKNETTSVIFYSYTIPLIRGD